MVVSSMEAGFFSKRQKSSFVACTVFNQQFEQALDVATPVLWQ